MSKDPKGFREFAFNRELRLIHRDDIELIASSGVFVDVWLRSGSKIRLPGVTYEEMKKWWRNDES
jgi:hypothetical protein